jgi:hypothetical protein
MALTKATEVTQDEKSEKGPEIVKRIEEWRSPRNGWSTC